MCRQTMRKEKRERLEELVALVRGGEPLETRLGAWGKSVGLEEESSLGVGA